MKLLGPPGGGPTALWLNSPSNVYWRTATELRERIARALRGASVRLDRLARSMALSRTTRSRILRTRAELEECRRGLRRVSYRLHPGDLRKDADRTR